MNRDGSSNPGSGPRGIERGRDWGVAAVVPAGLVECRDDQQAARASGAVFLTGGDVHRGLGRPLSPTIGDEATVVAVDRLFCEVTTAAGILEIPAFSHVLVGRLSGRSRFVACVNAGFVGALNLTPRSHPGDGRFEVLRIEEHMPMRQRMIARRKARTGTHVPHPGISISSEIGLVLERQGSEPLVIDGRRIRSWRAARITVEPGAVRVYL